MAAKQVAKQLNEGRLLSSLLLPRGKANAHASSGVSMYPNRIRSPTRPLMAFGRSYSTLYSPGSSRSDSITGLLQQLEQSFPPALRQDGWYLTTAAALTSCGLQRHLGSLYLHLVSQPRYQKPAQRQQLVRRIREALFKTIMICGIPRVMDGIASIARVEREEDQDHTIMRANWQADEENRKRGEAALEALFKDENTGIIETFGSHREISWISVNISYGCFLADYRILNAAETELVVLPAIMCQNLSGPTSWHVRASQNVGIGREDVKKIQLVTGMIAAFAGLDLDTVERL
ncbi:putative DNA polymerase alpha subunit B [Rosellinia necatrix]|uniref:Putative DNA polymerase alpha subunit B n=1 Tax=Rosellinia necatrix TaxID=77044 RepID=A0A1W2TTA0_ROSNE|nr:putative DNA polymerase alpha subunit B [Rosellinia necatrix]